MMELLYLLITLLAVALIVMTVVIVRQSKLLRDREVKLATLKEKEKLHDESIARQQETFEQQLRVMELQFLRLSEEVTKRRSEELSNSNKKEMDAILTPLKESITKMESHLRKSDLDSTERSAQLGKHIELLMAQTSSLGDKADNLSDALRQKNKVQGNWGEVFLENLLEREGFTKQQDFFTQFTLQGKTGILRPDFLVRLPDDRALIIDSKVSLTAYADYFEAEEEAEKERLLKQHLSSLTEHYKSLASKQYYKYLPEKIESLDYVIMFVPIPGALQLAFEAKPTLWREAFNQGVFITSHHNLIAALHIINDLWIKHRQDRNMEEIIQHASNLLDRVSAFYSEFESVNNKLEDAQNAYKRAQNRLRGREGLVSSATKIRDLGVKNSPNRPLPSEDN